MNSCIGAFMFVLMGAAALPSLVIAQSENPSVGYSLHVDPTRVEIVELAMRIEHAPDTLRLAMKVHPEYDAKYWRYLDPPWIDGTGDDLKASVVRDDSTIWTAMLPGGHGVVHYRVHVQPSAGTMRRAWQPFMRQTGGLINSPDFFLYLPDFRSAPVSVDVQVPPDWRIATSLERTARLTRFTAPNAAALLDAPILLGDLREWSFVDRGTRFHVVYWPLPEAAAFDTLALVSEIRRLTAATLDLFGHAPANDFYFLLQDGAGDALEHRSSLTLGITSAALAHNPRASLGELAHELFHTWNLVAIHPDTYGELSYKPPARTAGLWWGEGVTLYYADALPRRAGLSDPNTSRLDHLTRLLESYYAAPWNTRVSPQRASLAFGDSPIANPDATGGYYLQGELLGYELDALIRKNTHEKRSLDDVMRALYSASAGSAGFTDKGLERVADSVCGCQLGSVFANQIRDASLIDIAPVVTRLGLRVIVDTIPAADSTGPMPDLRIGIDFTRATGPLRLVIRNPATVWSLSGLRTGDVLVAINGTSPATFADLQRALRGLRVNDTVRVDVERAGQSMQFLVRVTGYMLPRVRFVEIENATPEQRASRNRWLAGW